METETTASARYSRGAVILHWLIALLIVLNVVAAWVSEDMSKADRSMVIGNHKAIGMIVILLTLVRIAWKLTHRAPPLVETLKTWEAALAKVTHAGFYFLMLALPLSGWAMSSVFSEGKPVNIFGLFGVPALPLGSEESTGDIFHEMHEVLGTVMVALFLLHVGAALKHHLVDKDGTMRRMVPWIK